MLDKFNQLNEKNKNMEVEYLTPQDANEIKGGGLSCTCKRGTYTVDCSKVYSSE
jgi:hypothetical protein